MERIGTSNPTENHFGFQDALDLFSGKTISNINQGINDATTAAANANKAVAFISQHWLLCLFALFVFIFLADFIAVKLA